MEGFIKKASNHSFTCKKCEKETKNKTGKPDIYCENLYSHLLSDIHKKKHSCRRRISIPNLEK